ncbi:hypothetical protein BaRGS_00003328 [Batillaria attramentaria]|uniref:Uncharacterized protein n=1 Tax=Batillaria attramentaria TaxID=370345 RepID=A0ABD0M1M9_9CAEN
MEVTGVSVVHHSQTKGRGRARGRARQHQTENVITRPGLNTDTMNDQNKTQPSRNQPTPLGENGASSDTISHSLQELSVKHTPAVNGPSSAADVQKTAENGVSHARSRRHRFENSTLSLINKHLGQARGSVNQSRSEERVNQHAPSSASAERLSPGLRLMIPGQQVGCAKELNGQTQRSRTVTFPPPPGYQTNVGSHMGKSRPVEVSCSSPPPDPAYKGMHDDRVGVSLNGRGRGRGRARGRVRHTEQKNHVLRPGIVSSGHPAPLQQTTQIDQFADSDHSGVDDRTPGTKAATGKLEMNGQQSSSYLDKNDELSTCAKLESTVVSHSGRNVSTGDVLSDTTPRFSASYASSVPHNHSASINDTVQSEANKQLIGVENLVGEVTPLTVHIPDTTNHTQPSKAISAPGHVTNANDKATLSSSKHNAGDSGTGSITSPDLLVTPPGYTKVLDWAAEVVSPTSPGAAPEWAVSDFGW